MLIDEDGGKISIEAGGMQLTWWGKQLTDREAGGEEEGPPQEERKVLTETAVESCLVTKQQNPHRSSPTLHGD